MNNETRAGLPRKSAKKERGLNRPPQETQSEKKGGKDIGSKNKKQGEAGKRKEGQAPQSARKQRTHRVRGKKIRRTWR